MAWMALGGTKKNIPQEFLKIVAQTTVLGQRRPFLPTTAISANMLSTAKVICESFLGTGNGNSAFPQPIDPTMGVLPDVYNNLSLIKSNGDAENWFRLCTYNPIDPSDSSGLGHHPTPVRILTVGSGALTRCNGVCEQSVLGGSSELDVGPDTLIDPHVYPPHTRVGNASGGVDPSLTGTNAWPWCVEPKDPTGTAYVNAHADQLPVCPSGLPSLTTDEGNAWAVRAAINAGLAVFLYVEDLEAKAAPNPDYDRCELLSAAPSPAK
jgi:hypothetical protein